MFLCVLDDIGGCTMKIAVGVATCGRKAILACMIDRLAAQTRRPDHLFLCPATDEDIDRRHAAFRPSVDRYVRFREQGDAGHALARAEMM